MTLAPLLVIDSDLMRRSRFLHRAFRDSGWRDNKVVAAEVGSPHSLVLCRAEARSLNKIKVWGRRGSVAVVPHPL